MSEQVEEAHRLVQEAQRVALLPALYASFIDTAAEAWVIVDSRGKIALFNRKATFLFGWLAPEVVGQPLEILLPEHLRERHIRHRASFEADPYTRPMGASQDLQARHKDGSTFPVLIDLHPEMSVDGMYVRAAIRRKDEALPDGGAAQLRNDAAIIDRMAEIYKTLPEPIRSTAE